MAQINPRGCAERFAAVAPELAFIKAGSLDDTSWLEAAIEVWTSSAHPWAPHFEHAAQLERGPQQ